MSRSSRSLCLVAAFLSNFGSLNLSCSSLRSQVQIVGFLGRGIYIGCLSCLWVRLVLPQGEYKDCSGSIVGQRTWGRVVERHWLMSREAVAIIQLCSDTPSQWNLFTVLLEHTLYTHRLHNKRIFIVFHKHFTKNTQLLLVRSRFRMDWLKLKQFVDGKSLDTRLESKHGGESVWYELRRVGD